MTISFWFDKQNPQTARGRIDCKFIERTQEGIKVDRKPPKAVGQERSLHEKRGTLRYLDDQLFKRNENDENRRKEYSPR
jgi:hypothetical protein